MVKIAGPLHSDGATGAFAGTLVFQKRKWRTCAYSLTSTTNPPTAKQTEVRTLLRQLTKAWPLISSTDRDSWTEPAESAGMSPQNLFVKENFNLATNGRPTTMAWPPPPDQAPIGTITAWAKSNAGTPALPANWMECNGQTCNLTDSPYNGKPLPNLNGASAATKRFLRGSSTSGTIGGEDSHVLSATEMPAHTHTVTAAASISVTTGGTAGAAPRTNTATSSAGGNLAHENRPPFYEVVWIIRVL